MDKLRMQTTDLTDKNIERIASLFPNVITETKDENGNIKKAVDFDLLKQSLSKDLVEGDDERYRLDWPGKKASLLKANTPITKTLRPCREESVNFDTTENLYIEGDNFEVLKILQESYLGKMKMIYIDPPYNRGDDFIYKDNFAKSKEEYEDDLGVTDDEGGKLFRNTDSNGRFHSDWLSMLYERLVVARDLLKNDGVIFISIDDNEVHNLRKICDEIFGENNFITNFIWEKGKEGGNDSSIMRSHYDNIMFYCKDSSQNNIINLDGKDKSRHITCDKEKNLVKGIEKDANAGELFQLINLSKQKDYTVKIPLIDGSEIAWNSYAPQTSIDLWIKEGKVFVGEKKVPYIKSYLKDELQGQKPSNIIGQDFGTTKAGSIEMRDFFGSKEIFPYPKPSILIKRLLAIGGSANEIVLDFFSGSATTAHAVMQLNAEDGGNRKFIMVQLPEKTGETSEAYKAGYKTIAEIGKERIRRAGKKIVEGLKTKNQQLELGQELVDASKLDIGFRVYKIDESNMKDVFYHPAKLDQKQLAFLESNIKEDRTPEDLLTQVILDLGLELSLPVEKKKIGKNMVFIVQTNALVACFDNDIDFKIVDTIAGLKPFKVVFKDASFKDDKDRINVEERFKRLSPETKVTVI